MALFVRITPRSARQRADGALYAFDLTEEQLVERVITPYDHGRVITLSGRSLPAADISSVDITEIHDAVLGNPLSQLRSLWTTGSRRQTGDWIAKYAPSVTDRYIKGPPGRLVGAGPTHPTQPTAAPAPEMTSTEDAQAERRSPLFGRLRRLPTPLAIVADIITVGLFVALIVGALLAALSGGGHLRPVVTTHRTAQSRSATPSSTAAKSSPTQDPVGQIEQGDIYRAADITGRSQFADLIDAHCGDTVAYRVRVHNGGPAVLANVKVAASLNQANRATSHGSVVRVSANNNLDGTVVMASSGVRTTSPSIAAYIRGSTELLNYSLRPGGESVIRRLPDGVLTRPIKVGNIGPLSSDTVALQFEAKLSC